MPGPRNAIIGDDANYGMDLPEYQIEEDEALRELSKAARFSRTTEFKALRDKLETRIEYYKGYQPGGAGGDVALIDMNNDERGWRVLAADLIIKEFQAVIAAYELAYQEVKEATAKREAANKKST